MEEKDNAGITVSAANMEYLRDTIRERDAAYELLFSKYETVMSCGHKTRYLVDGKEGTIFCALCEMESETRWANHYSRKRDAAQQSFTADETNRLRDLLWVGCLCGACGHSYKYNRADDPKGEKGHEEHLLAYPDCPSSRR